MSAGCGAENTEWAGHNLWHGIGIGWGLPPLQWCLSCAHINMQFSRQTERTTARRDCAREPDVGLKLWKTARAAAEGLDDAVARTNPWCRRTANADREADTYASATAEAFCG